MKHEKNIKINILLFTAYKIVTLDNSRGKYVL